MIVGYFELKLNRHILGTPETNITSCKKGHNRCSLKSINGLYFLNTSSWFYSIANGA